MNLENGKMVFIKPAISNHAKTLYLKTHANSKPQGKLLVDNDSVVKVTPLKTLIVQEKTKDNIMATNLMVI